MKYRAKRVQTYGARPRAFARLRFARVEKKPPSRMAVYERFLTSVGWFSAESRERATQKILEKLGEPQIIVKPFYGEMHDVKRYYWVSDERGLKAVADMINQGDGVYEVIKSPIPLKTKEPEGYFVQAKREGDELYHTTHRKKLVGNKLDPELTNVKFIGATTHPLRHPGPMPYFGVLEPQVFKVKKEDHHKFKPCIYPISEAELKRAKADLEKQGYRIMSAEEVKREYGKDWYKYLEPIDFLYENEWRAFEPVEVEYVGDVHKLYKIPKKPKPKLRIAWHTVSHLKRVAEDTSGFRSPQERERAQKALEALRKYFMQKWTWEDIKREAKRLGVKGLHNYNKFGALTLLARAEFGDEAVNLMESALDYG